MSSLWSDIALARAARAKGDDTSTGGKAAPKAERPEVRRPVRRVLLPLRPIFAL
jgi:hypothetical protein